jgi:hypothetical protein
MIKLKKKVIGKEKLQGESKNNKTNRIPLENQGKIAYNQRFSEALR